ncbi:hypothetical protein A3A39_00465 [Candidatus Kaiserbacteria bacterium RIFCSPLOWO2_01_FULL_54_13]|uniref:PIN domain-containing protein n=1 Tax=Candidatus Kaiserbacteria bacterium RIFCSPLOWO2_01_FULL_54_13 TaxID=1798512 RepID=A0A1F6F0M9_9BACT|nr:MAG: hypothetical protein A3A39_00465 [Candidatus Kaiserbacteria bacterium RIFCSPLOWO2_01_FULL_54_13]
MTLDTNAIIAFLGGEEAIVELFSNWKQRGVPLFLPTVVEAEVLSFQKWTQAEQRNTELFLEEHFVSIPFERAIARIAAGLRRISNIELPDAAIAASALYTHSPLVTRNVKDFRKVTGLTIVEI